MKKLSLKDADDLALSFRTEYGIGNTQPFHAKTILRKLNILTVYRPLSENLHGLSLKSKDLELEKWLLIIDQGLPVIPNTIGREP